MKYKNAQVILPDALVKELQSYVQGEYIYVPVEQEQQKRWGDKTRISKRYFYKLSCRKILPIFICCSENYISKVR